MRSRQRNGPAARVRVRIPAKINLFLAVRGRRDDGFHEIVTVFQTVALHDEVEAALEGESVFHPAARRLMSLEFEHDGGALVPDDRSNLAVRAACALARTIGVERIDEADSDSGPVTRLRLTKRIPVAAGMAGGSADAAATLVALNRLWDCDLDRDEIRAIAERLGADVPFCVVGGTALATGTGAATAQVLCHGTFHWVVGVHDVPLATADVYRAWDAVAVPSQVEPDAVLQALRTRDAEALGAALHNELEPATFHLRPALREARDALLEAGALGAVVSGSGPTVVGLASDAASAATIAEQVGGRFARVHVVTSPAGGPETFA